MPEPDDYIPEFSTSSGDAWKTMLPSLAIAVLINLPIYNWIFGTHWHWAEGFPLGWLSSGLVYMSTFFHELGHTVFAWFYGYPTLPIFDFKHGGGLAVGLTDQQILMVLLFYAGLAYGLYYFKEQRILQIALIALFIFNLATAFNEKAHFNVIDFMGPAAEPLIACFFLIRALFDLAPRGQTERILNGILGFAMIFQVFINCYGLLYDHTYRLLYYEQKGTHGFGDFDKIASRTLCLDFQDVVYIWGGLGLICLILPFILYWKANTLTRP